MPVGSKAATFTRRVSPKLPETVQVAEPVVKFGVVGNAPPLREMKTP